MRKIRIIEHISLDGVIQGFGGPEEDRDGDYTHGGWAVPHSDPAIGGAIDAAQGERFDLLLGRHREASLPPFAAFPLRRYTTRWTGRIVRYNQTSDASVVGSPRQKALMSGASQCRPSNL